MLHAVRGLQHCADRLSRRNAMHVQPALKQAGFAKHQKLRTGMPTATTMVNLSSRDTPLWFNTHRTAECHPARESTLSPVKAYESCVTSCDLVDPRRRRCDQHLTSNRGALRTPSRWWLRKRRGQLTPTVDPRVNSCTSCNLPYVCITCLASGARAWWGSSNTRLSHGGAKAT